MSDASSLPLSLASRLAAARLLGADRAELEGRLRGIEGRRRRGQPVDRVQAEWLDRLGRAEARWTAFQGSVPRLDYPQDLPVSREREVIISAIAAHPVVIVCGDTGSGKTTQLPKMAFEAGGGHFGRIGVTQPRRLAATGMARRVAEECGSELGGTVGVTVRFEDKTSEATRIQFMTDGILLARLPQDPDWRAYNTLIIDEAHERSLNIDFILGCLHGILRRRDDLKVVISSATLDAGRFSAFFDGAPVISVEGRLFPIEDVHLPEFEESDMDTEDQVVEALERLDAVHGELDTLVFLPGEREIRECARKIEGRYRQRAEVLPLFARLSLSDQNRVFTRSGRRRIVLSTNVAETSLTLPGIRAVIDTGQVRVNRFDPRQQVQRLMTERVSQASARQRRGRCGRTGPGVCVRLYSEESLLKAPAHSDPEIRRDSLAEVILRMALLGLPPLGEFPLLDPPRGAQIAEGYRTLVEIGAMTEGRVLTPRGRRLASFPLEPRLARMLEEGHHERILPAVLVCTAFLSIQDPRERPADQAEAADRAHAAWKHPESDFLGMLALWNDVCAESASRGRRARFSRAHFLNPRRMEEWIRLVDDLRDTCADMGWELPSSIGHLDEIRSDSLHRAILSGVPRSVGERTDEGNFRAPNGQGFLVFPGSGLAKKPPRWVMAFTLVETSRLYGRECARIDPLWVEQVAPHLCRYQYERPVWNGSRGFVEAEERVSLGSLTLRYGKRVHYGRIDPVAARGIFLRDGLAAGDLPEGDRFLARYRELLGSLEGWERKLRRPGALVGSDALVAHFDRLLPAELCSVSEFRDWTGGRDWVPRIRDLLRGHPCDAADYPDTLRVNGVQVSVVYAYTPEDPARDGAAFEVAEADLPRLPDELLEWTIPAWLEDKVVALLRSLDKPLRTLCAPYGATARDAISWFDQNGFRYTHSLYKALAAYLAARLGRILAAPDLHPETLPPHLVTRLRVRDGKGELLHEGPSFPGARAAAAERPSSLRHDPFSRDALVARFRREFPDPIRYLEKKFPLPTAIQLDLAQMRALPDLIDGVVAEALGEVGKEEDWAMAADRGRGILFEVAEKRGEALRRIFELRGRVLEALDKVPPGAAADDLAFQQNLLWLPGWCSDPENLLRYPRFLQAVLSRLERLARDPAKDARKQEELEPALEALAAAATRLRPGQLREAFRKMEDLRISTFAPELRPFEKISLKRFQEWLQSPSVLHKGERLP